MEKTLKKLRAAYPDIEWCTIEPAPEILRDFGDGTILSATLHGRTRDFFILAGDKRKEQWGHVAAHHLHEGEENVWSEEEN